jgi:hypothetical protein
MKNALIRERATALAQMADRVLPSKTSVNKVATLLATRFKAALQDLEAQRLALVVQAHPFDGDGELPPAIKEARELAFAALMEQSTPVRKVPDSLRLTADDMPRALASDESNGAGVAALRVMLGTLYVTSNEEKSIDEATEGEED